MAINLPVLPADISVGAVMTPTFNTSKNTSEGGISGRNSFRDQVIRNYILSIAPGPASAEFLNIILAIRGQRRPLAMRDWTSYTAVDQVLDWTATTTTTAPLRKLFQPATGGYSYYQRILVLDGSPTFKINGGALPGGVTATINDPAIVSLNTVLTDSDVLTWSGNYFVPVCSVDDPAASIKTSSVYSFDSVRFEEILEAELVALTS